MDALDRLIKSFASLDASGRAGIIGDETNASKLLWNEMGTNRAPARPTITRAFDASAKDIEAKMAASMGKVVDGSASGRAVVEEAASALAEATREAIKSNTPPPLADATKESRMARGNASDATLIDTGAMLGAVRHEVKRGAEGWKE